MRREWKKRSVGIAVTVACLTAARAGATTGYAVDVGVLDRLAVPAVPAGERADGRPVGPVPSADAIAVPTPTAGQSGLAVLSGLVIWRTFRRVANRA